MGAGCAACCYVMRDAVAVAPALIRPGSDAELPHLPVGTRLRILPHHACATASQHHEYVVVDGSGSIEATWPRSGGW